MMVVYWLDCSKILLPFMPISRPSFFRPFTQKISLPVATLISPQEDTFLAVQFGQRSLSKRKDNKKVFLQELNIDKARVNKPLLIILLSLFQDSAAREILSTVLVGLQSLDLNVVVLGPKAACSDALLDRYYQVDVSEKKLHQALAAGDMVLLPTVAEQKLSQACLEYGIVPVASADQSMMTDYDPTLESGNAFVFRENSPWAMFAAVVRALETFKLPYDWQRIQRNGMEK